MKITHTSLCVLGAGIGGITAAKWATKLGLKVILIDHSQPNEVQNLGFIHTKALLHAAKKIKSAQLSQKTGVSLTPSIDGDAVMAYARERFETLSKNDSIEELTALGVQVIKGQGQFIDDQHFKLDDHVIRAKKYIVASGSKAKVDIPGLENTNYFTYENLFSESSLPEEMTIIGAGPMGVEIAYAHALLGVQVTLFEAKSLLHEEDSVCVNIIQKTLLDLGVKIIENAHVGSVEPQGEGAILKYSITGAPESHETERLFVATGCIPNVKKLGLEKASIHFKHAGIVVNKYCKTTNKRIYAIGNVTGDRFYPHAAVDDAIIALKNICFKFSFTRKRHDIPWVLYTNPGFARVGLTELKAKAQIKNVRILSYNLEKHDRAQIEHRTEGIIKVFCTPFGRVVGASIVSHHANELIQPWCLAIQHNLNVLHIAKTSFPYPSWGEINKHVAALFITEHPKLKLLQKITRFSLKWLTL